MSRQEHLGHFAMGAVPMLRHFSSGLGDIARNRPSSTRLEQLLPTQKNSRNERARCRFTPWSFDEYVKA